MFIAFGGEFGAYVSPRKCGASITICVYLFVIIAFVWCSLKICHRIFAMLVTQYYSPNYGIAVQQK